MPLAMEECFEEALLKSINKLIWVLAGEANQYNIKLSIIIE